ncbi:SET domain-containing protein [Massarina eburnea CBS 473.64]|uniref:SET domain-containing protein n=1 Tax=Massarina eburnea CBS 473.64 TaxID=1395130 RepID=A0A6A6RLI3_9PLEO|nr:SET domain-containing protein [Massarina eburnea CBS 473.64]
MTYLLLPLLLILPLTILAETSTCPPTPLLLPTCAYPPEPYTIERSPGKGLGVFSRADLTPGTIILREPAILSITPPAISKGTGYPMPMISSLVREAYEQLSEAAQHAVLNLHFHVFPGELENGHGWEEPLGYIFRTNAYNTGEGIALFPKIARINHSCRPNAGYYWDGNTGQRVVYASRHIAAGDEVFDSYIPLLLPRHRRHERLERYGFTCSCPTCMLSGSLLSRSDRRRDDIAMAFMAFKARMDLLKPNSSSELREARRDAAWSLELVDWVEREGLVDYFAQAYKIVAVSHARVGDWEMASVWANKGFERRVLEYSGSGWAAEMGELTRGFIERWKEELGVGK